MDLKNEATPAAALASALSAQSLRDRQVLSDLKALQLSLEPYEPAGLKAIVKRLTARCEGPTGFIGPLDAMVERFNAYCEASSAFVGPLNCPSIEIIPGHVGGFHIFPGGKAETPTCFLASNAELLGWLACWAKRRHPG